MRILIDNALTHTPEGTAITVDRTSQSEDRNGSSLVVTDDGPGIDARARERVFERFYTGDEVSGSGLGLAIARELAGPHGRARSSSARAAARPSSSCGFRPPARGERLERPSVARRGAWPAAALLAARRSSPAAAATGDSQTRR